MLVLTSVSIFLENVGLTIHCSQYTVNNRTNKGILCFLIYISVNFQLIIRFSILRNQKKCGLYKMSIRNCRLYLSVISFIYSSVTI